jgi:hypothetical protein
MKCLQSKILTYFVHSSYLLQCDSAGRTVRQLLWRSLRLSPAGIVISSCLSMLTYYLGDEQQTRWWLRFRDIVSFPSTRPTDPCQLKLSLLSSGPPANAVILLENQAMTASFHTFSNSQLTYHPSFDPI